MQSAINQKKSFGWGVLAGDMVHTNILERGAKAYGRLNRGVETKTKKGRMCIMDADTRGHGFSGGPGLCVRHFEEREQRVERLAEGYRSWIKYGFKLRGLKNEDVSVEKISRGGKGFAFEQETTCLLNCASLVRLQDTSSAQPLDFLVGPCLGKRYFAGKLKKESMGQPNQGCEGLDGGRRQQGRSTSGQATTSHSDDERAASLGNALYACRKKPQ